MSFLKKLFGGGEDSGGAKPLGTEEYKAYRITAVQMVQNGEYLLAGTVEKEVDGEMKTHSFVRADRLPSADMAAQAALAKGRQLIDEQGDRLFG